MDHFIGRRVAVSCAALLLLSPLALAQTPPAVDDAHERQIVSTASRKMLELQRESDGCVVNAVPDFLRRLALLYRSKAPVMYGAMRDAGAKLKGSGPTCPSRFTTLYHVASAKGVFTYNVSDEWKREKAKKLPLKDGRPVEPNSAEVLSAWMDDVATSGDIPANMLLADSVALPPLSWVTPDERMKMPPGASREDGTDAFFKFCHTLSLAPEWYPDGLVNMHYAAISTTLIRPVSFDGMLSPLWVQHPPTEAAATGGGAEEAFNKAAVRVSAALPMQAYVLTSEMSAALRKSPSVNDYSDDLTHVAIGPGEAGKRLGKEQADIVREVRQARGNADTAFEKVPAIAIPIERMRGCRAVRRAELEPNGSDLAAVMAAWAHDGQTEHPGQRFPAERFEAEAARSPEAAHAIAVATTTLLRTSDDPAVLAMAAQLGFETGYRPYYVALLDRLDAKPRPPPDGPGIRSLTVNGDLIMRLEDRLPTQDTRLAKQAYALLERERRPDIRLGMMIDSANGSALLRAFRAAARMPKLDPWLAARAGRALAQKGPQHLREAFAIAAHLRPEAHARFVEAARTTGTSLATR